MSTKISLAQMIQQIEMTLNTMKMGIDLYKNNQNDRSQKDAGLRNAVVFGRAVTNSLQKLRGTELGKSEFDSWYRPWQTKLKEDEGFRFLYKLRSQILKEGILETSSEVHINYLDTRDVYDLMKKHHSMSSRCSLVMLMVVLVLKLFYQMDQLKTIILNYLIMSM